MTDVVFGKRVPIDPTLNSYTELFFLDTPTALAAGHRPCAQCKREEHLAFRSAWFSAGLSEPTNTSIVVLDAELNKERGANQRSWLAKLQNLPTGAIVRLPGDSTFFLVTPKNRLLCWSFDGYLPGPELSGNQDVEVVTRPSMVKLLAAGFVAKPHPTAQALAGA